jgi:glutathione S-transferase
MKLIIANKNYSSWSMRPWLLMRHAGIAFDEELISFNDPDWTAKIRRHAPTGKVPVLIDDGVTVWDSLAIVEYLAESFPDKHLWPDDRAARARARSLCAELHSGFQHMRERMPMNCQARFGNVLFDAKVRRDVARVVEIWTECRARHKADGPFLFGRFSIADAFFAPVTRRFVTYGVDVPEPARVYVEAVGALPAMQEWLMAAASEREFVAMDEPYREPPV